MDNGRASFLLAVDALAKAIRQRAPLNLETPALAALHAYASEWIDEIAEDLGAHVARGQATRGIILDDAERWALTRYGFGKVVTWTEGHGAHGVTRREMIPRTPSKAIGLPFSTALDGLIKHLAPKADTSPKIREALTTLTEARSKLAPSSSPA